VRVGDAAVRQEDVVHLGRHARRKPGLVGGLGLAHERGDVRPVRVELLDEPAAGERDAATAGLLARRPVGPRVGAAGQGGKK
jgi:hypothetical protein